MDKHPDAGKLVRLENKEVFKIIDWWINFCGRSWMNNASNAVCINYAIRASLKKLPIDDNVVFGYVGHLGHLVHQSELEKMEVLKHV